MAKICEMCFGTGKTPAGFCPCTEGKMLKTLEQANERAKEREKIEEQKKKEEPKAAKIKRRNVAPASQSMEKFEALGSKDMRWVVIRTIRVGNKAFNNVRGYIVESRGAREFLIQTVDLHERAGVNVMWWVLESEFSYLPQELKTADIISMIDLALMLKDEQWFNELVKMEATR